MTREEYMEIKTRLDMGIGKRPPPGPAPRPQGVRDTSMIAYEWLKETGALGKQEHLVYEYVKKEPQPVTRQEISSALRIGINAVTGRVFGLIAKGLLEECGIKQCRVTGQNVNALRAKQ